MASEMKKRSLAICVGDGLDVHAEDTVLYKVELAPEVGVAVLLECFADFFQLVIALLLVGCIESGDSSLGGHLLL